MSENPTLQIPRDVIEPIINAHINAAVMTAIGGHKQIVERAIATVLQTKVDSNGHPDRYNSSSGIPWIDWAVGNTIRKVAEEAILAALEKHKEQIREALVASLRQKNSPLIRQLVEGMCGALSSDHLKYRINVTAEPR